jgi:16S rRNA (cytidine1402-2'-O)-methyltransferase
MTDRGVQGMATLGKLYLVPAPLDFGSGLPVEQLPPIQAVLPSATLEVAARLQHWVVENAKTARAVIKRISAVQALQSPLQALQMQELPRAVHKGGDRAAATLGLDARPLLAPCLQGHDVGLMSEAGMPAIADPGAYVVRAAHGLGIEVVPLTGPISLALALAASGLDGQRFAFIGYLPTDEAERAQRIRTLEKSARAGETQIIIETPYRNAALLQALLATLQPATRLAVSLGLGLPGARNFSATTAEWQSGGWVLPDNVPAVFLIGR